MYIHSNFQFPSGIILSGFVLEDRVGLEVEDNDAEAEDAVSFLCIYILIFNFYWAF